MKKKTVAKKKVKAEEAVITVTRTILKDDPVATTEHIKVRVFATDTIRVGTTLGVTMNMGSYESMRVDVKVDMPCYIEEAKECFGQVVRFAFSRLKEEVEGLKKEFPKIN